MMLDWHTGSIFSDSLTRSMSTLLNGNLGPSQEEGVPRIKDSARGLFYCDHDSVLKLPLTFHCRHVTISRFICWPSLRVRLRLNDIFSMVAEQKGRGKGIVWMSQLVVYRVNFTKVAWPAGELFHD